LAFASNKEPLGGCYRKNITY